MLLKHQVREHLLSKGWEGIENGNMLHTMVGERPVRIFLKERVFRVEEKLDRYGGYWWHRIGGAKYKEVNIRDGRLDGISSIY